MHSLTQDFMSLFEGFADSHGTYEVTGEIEENGKKKGKAVTVMSPVTSELWSDHLIGRKGLGIVPVTQLGKVKFGAIDVDVYDGTLSALLVNLKDNQLPLIPCRTKSGGLHLYLFLTDWCPAKLVQQKLREMAAFLGYGTSEIFPKQSIVMTERGDQGSWINMPYQNASKTTRYMMDFRGERMTAEVFVKAAYDARIAPETLVSMKFLAVEAEALVEGPPCLNYLATKGFPMGTRNNGIFNLGVYAQKTTPDGWQDVVRGYNEKFMDPPLSKSEVEGAIKSLSKSKGYNYTCSQQPICSFCNKGMCRTKKFGVGMGGDGMPKMGTLTKIDTNPPVWFLEVEGGGRMECLTEDLQNIRNYQLVVMKTQNLMPPLVKNEVWSDIIGKLFQDVNVVAIPTEATPRGILWHHLIEFCTSRVQAKEREEILLGKPWRDPTTNMVYFRIIDLWEYLQRQKFREFEMNRVALYLHDWGADKGFWNLKGKGVNWWAMPELDKATGNFKVPEDIRKNIPI